MSGIYNGVAANVTPQSVLNITGVTAGATPTITISGTLPGSIVTTFTVNIYSVVGATGVNGTWTGTKTGPSTFTVPSGAPGSYVSGGKAQPVILQAITIPNDGDTRSAASVTVPFGSLQDQIAFLAAGTGLSKVVQHYTLSAFPAFAATVGACQSAAGVGAFTGFTGTIASMMPFITVGSVSSMPVQVGDIVKVSFFTNLFSAVVNNYGLALFTANYLPGTSPTFTQLAESGTSELVVPTVSGGISLCVPVTLIGHVLILTTGLFDFEVQICSSNAMSASDALLKSAMHVEATLYRQTFMPQ